MNDAPIDLTPLSDWLDPPRVLRERIAQRVGDVPQTLPAREWLALEAWSIPVGAAALLLCAMALLTARLQPERTRAPSLATLLNTAAQGGVAPAADVYVIATRAAR